MKSSVLYLAGILAFSILAVIPGLTERTAELQNTEYYLSACALSIACFLFPSMYLTRRQKRYPPDAHYWRHRVHIFWCIRFYLLGMVAMFAAFYALSSGKTFLALLMLSGIAFCAMVTARPLRINTDRR